MNQRQQRSLRLVMMVSFACWCGRVAFGDTESPSVSPTRRWVVDISLISYSRQDSLATYQSHGGGEVGPRGRVGLTAAAKDNRPEFRVQVSGKMTSRGMVTELEVASPTDHPGVRVGKSLHDTWDLVPRSVEIAHDEERNISYQLNLIPRIVEEPPARQFSVEDLRMDYWHFGGSTVVVNDQDYAGELTMGGGPIAWIDVIGVAKVEFSLRQLTNASPTGRLHNGVLDLTDPNGTALRIAGVKNGVNESELSGGPYRVWVRWQPSDYSDQQAAAMLKEQLASLTRSIQSGEVTDTPGLRQRLENVTKRVARGDPVLISHGCRGAKSEDFEQSKK